MPPSTGAARAITARELTPPPRGVGQTAIFVAWLRQQESERPDALFRDPFAEAMLAALAGEPALAEVAEVIRRSHVSIGGFSEYFAVRTRFFDDALRTAMDAGSRQIVTLASGLDGRPLRLPCPPGTRWYEVDMPDMTAFKDGVIAHSGLAATCKRRGVAADLTHPGWPASLRLAGFDPRRPTVWLIEGLLMYLAPDAGDALLAEATRLSAPGSRLMLEHLQAKMLADEGTPARERVQSQGARWLAARDDLEGWLAGHGWTAEVYTGSDPRIGHGRTVAPLPACWLASGTLASISTQPTPERTIA